LWGPATEKLADPFVEVACSIDMVCSSIRVWYLSGPQVKLNELTKLQMNMVSPVCHKENNQN